MSELVERDRASAIVEALCAVPVDRRPGSLSNDRAVDYAAQNLSDAGFAVSTPQFECLDWECGEAAVTVQGSTVSVTPSPYGLGIDTSGPLRVVTSIDDLRSEDIHGAVVVVTGNLSAEPLTPKAFPFYGSDKHTAIIDALESASPRAVVAVTGKYPALCGALDPFPWIEDGDFSIPSASVRPIDAGPLLSAEGRSAAVTIEAQRIPSQARNVTARLGPTGPRITVCAHIDTKPGTPGAVDNAAGVAVLLMLADRLGADNELPIGVELLAVNGEDHYAAPGEVAWLDANRDGLDDVALFVNIDAAGYMSGRTSYSFYNVDDAMVARARNLLIEYPDLVEGPQWFQSDHAIFALRGRPAMAFTTEFVQEMLAELFHSASDIPAQVEPDRIVSLARALEQMVRRWSSS